MIQQLIVHHHALRLWCQGVSDGASLTSPQTRHHPSLLHRDAINVFSVLTTPRVVAPPLNQSINLLINLPHDYHYLLLLIVLLLVLLLLLLPPPLLLHTSICRFNVSD